MKTDNMKILIISSQTPEKSSTFIKNQFRYLHSEHILHSGFRPYIYKNQSIFKFPLNNNFIRAGIKRILPFLYTRFYESALTRFLLKMNFDVVLGNYGTQSSNIAVSCKRAGVPLVVHFHGYDAYIHSVLKKYEDRYRMLFQISSSIITVSNDMAIQLKSLGAPEEKVVVNPYGVDNTLFSQCRPDLNGKRLIFVGRFIAKKAPDLLLKAFHRTLQRVPEAILIMIGHGELYEKTVKTIAELNITDHVKLLGWQSPEVIASEMGNARAYVQHSKFAENGDAEGTPNSILEAACCGLPVISTKHTGIKEAVLDGITGYLVEEGDWESMSNYMADLLLNPGQAYKMGNEAREHILKHYNIHIQIEKLSTILRKNSEK